MGKLNLQLCPRCELNYCENGQEYCKICLAEIERNSSSVESEEKILCPICKSVYISMDEDMCENCLKEKTYDDFEPADDDKAEKNWRSYIENTEVSEDDDVNNEEIEEIQNIEKEGLIDDVDINLDIDEDMEKQFSEEYGDEFDDDDDLEKDFDESLYDDDSSKD